MLKTKSVFRIVILLSLLGFYNLSRAQNVDQETNALIENYKKQAADFKQQNNATQQAGFLNKIAYLYWENSMYNEAAQYFKESLELNKQTNNVNGIKSILYNIGLIYSDLEDYNSAKMHTATHLLHQALREVLGEETRQMGSSISPDGFRFDFSYPSKLTSEQIEEIEGIVNKKIKQALDVRKQEMEYSKALQSEALSFFKEKYPEKVNVFLIGDFSFSPAQIFSREICAGPHVKNTSELKKFIIKKEESSSAGVRRIRAVLEK